MIQRLEQMLAYIVASSAGQDDLCHPGLHELIRSAHELSRNALAEQRLADRLDCEQLQADP